MAVVSDSHGVQFEAPRAQSSRCGLNPNVAGYQKRIAAYTLVLYVCCAATGLIVSGLSIARLLSPSAGLAMFAALLLPTAGFHYLSYHSEYCSMCGARTRGPLANRKMKWCPGCNNLTDPLQIGIGVVGRFDLTDWRYDDPIPRFMALTTLLAIMDQGHEIVFEPMSNEYRVRIRIGAFFEFFLRWRPGAKATSPCRSWRGREEGQSTAWRQSPRVSRRSPRSRRFRALARVPKAKGAARSSDDSAKKDYLKPDQDMFTLLTDKTRLCTVVYTPWKLAASSVHAPDGRLD
jgi:hypothetical protein